MQVHTRPANTTIHAKVTLICKNRCMILEPATKGMIPVFYAIMMSIQKKKTQKCIVLMSFYMIVD